MVGRFAPSFRTAFPVPFLNPTRLSAGEQFMSRVLCLPLLLFAFASFAPAADWWQFGGPTGDGHAGKANLPTEWTPTRNVAWRTAIAGLGWSSPVVANGKMYVTTAVPQGEATKDVKPDHSLRTICLDAKSGSVIWDVEVFRQSGKDAPNIHGKNSHASPTPLVEGDKVYVHFGHMGTACLNVKDGSSLWSNRTLAYQPVHGNGGSLLLLPELLVYSIDGTDKQAVIALNKSDGKVAWETPRNSKPGRPFSFSTPILITVNEKEQVISVGSDVVMALEPKTGKEIWRVKFTGYSVVPKPVFAHGLIYVCTGYDNAGLIAIRVDEKSAGDVTESHIAWSIKKPSMPRNVVPIVVGDAMYTVNDDGLLTCLDAKTGKERWNENLAKQHTSSPIYAGGLIYLLAEDGTATVFKPGAEFDEVAKNKFTEPGPASKYLCLSSYAVDGDALILRTAKAIYRIEKK
jgi:outer membrane protein assembly factor BamB